MQCERLIKLVKAWYLHVKDETMAPARMVQFIKQHVAECPICETDPDIQAEIDQITEIVLPESKIPKAVRLKQEMEDAEADEEAEEEEQDRDETGDEDDYENGETSDFEDDDEQPLTAEGE